MNRVDNIGVLRSNKIFVYDNFLSSEKCNELVLQINNDLWEESTVATIDDSLQYRQFYSPGRTNKICHYYNFDDELRKKIKFVEKKISMKANLDPNKFEYWQISKYGFGDKFDFHNDCGCCGHDQSGEREKTILLYLMSPSRGGETYFRALNLYVRPIQGRLVTWDNLLPNGECNYGMVHGALPIKEGIKITLNTWVRQKIFKQ